MLDVRVSWMEAFQQLCRSESVEATVIGRFCPTGNLKLKYQEHTVAEVSMAFLHDGRPPVIRKAVFQPIVRTPGVDSAEANTPRNAAQLRDDLKTCVDRMLDILAISLLSGRLQSAVIHKMCEGPLYGFFKSYVGVFGIKYSKQTSRLPYCQFNKTATVIN